MHDHCDPKIIHRDVKAANILLDEDFEAVVGDFGLAKLMDYKDTHVTTAVRGTIGHIAPEYLSTGKSSEKTDVFGYGIMLLELITGQRAFDLARLANDDDVMLLDWVNYFFFLISDHTVLPHYSSCLFHTASQSMDYTLIVCFLNDWYQSLVACLVIMNCLLTHSLVN